MKPVANGNASGNLAFGFAGIPGLRNDTGTFETMNNVLLEQKTHTK